MGRIRKTAFANLTNTNASAGTKAKAESSYHLRNLNYFAKLNKALMKRAA